MRRLGSYQPSPRVERLIWGVALLIFLAALASSYLGVPALTPDWRWLAFAAASSPAVMLLNGLEYHTAGWMLGERVRLAEAIRITILSSAANMLPVPGAVLVRSHGLRRRGQKYGPALGSTIAIGIGWVGVAFLLAGLTQVAARRGAVGVASSLIGLSLLTGMAILVRTISRKLPGTVVRIVALETAFVLVSGFRLYATMRGIGIDASYAQGVGLTVAGALASAVGVLPGGLGLRELLAGALGPLMGLPSAAGVLGAAVERLIGLSLLSLAAGLIFAGHGGISSRSAAERSRVDG